MSCVFDLSQLVAGVNAAGTIWKKDDEDLHRGEAAGTSSWGMDSEDRKEIEWTRRQWLLYVGEGRLI